MSYRIIHPNFNLIGSSTPTPPYNSYSAMGLHDIPITSAPDLLLHQQHVSGRCSV